MRSSISPTIGVYFSHYECFGHTSIVMAVGEVFKKRFPSGNLFFVQAGLKQPQAKINCLGKVYSLPGAFVSRRNFRELVGTPAHTYERSTTCLEIITRENPNLFITEFFPLGWEECRYELRDSLVKLSQKNAGLWGVSGHPLLIGIKSKWRDAILSLYQKIIIFSPPLEKELMADCLPSAIDRQKYLNFFKENHKKIVFAGYLLPGQDVVTGDRNESILNCSIPKDVCRVTVVRGGGAFYPKVIAQAIKMSDLLGKDYFLTVVAGPSTSKEEWELFSALVSKKKVNNLRLINSAANYEELIKESDVCVSMAGYNTAVMLLKHSKKTVVIPFEGYGSMWSYEQPARALLLEKMIGAKILSIHELNSANLKAAIQEIARKKVSSLVPKGWFSGRKSLDKALAENLLSVRNPRTRQA